jgi:hypothetical protein
MVDGAGASSLTVFSGHRFVRRAAARDIPIAIVNTGRTRGDGLATVKVDGGCRHSAPRSSASPPNLSAHGA